MSAADHLRDAIAEGCTRGDEHDHIGDYRDEVLRETAAEIHRVGTAKGWSVWAAPFINPDIEFVDAGMPSTETIVAELRRLDRAEVLREAANVVRSMDTDPSTQAAADLLRRMADEAGKDTRKGESTQLAGQQLAGAVLDDVTDSEPNQPPHCARCHQHFDPTDTRFDGHAQYSDTPFCRQCVDRCHESGDAFHQCAVCRTPAEGGGAR